MFTIVNIKHKPTPSYTLYLGRANKWLDLEESKWHNPFPMKTEKERPLCIYRFASYAVKNDKLISSLHELANEVGGCYCKPKLCHGDVLNYLLTVGQEQLKLDLIEMNENEFFEYLTNWSIKNENMENPSY